LDLIGQMQTHATPTPASTPLRVPTFTEEGLPDSLYLEKLTHNLAAHVGTLFHRALLSALQNVPDLQIEVCTSLGMHIRRLKGYCFAM
jgi:hypothetical protein